MRTPAFLCLVLVLAGCVAHSESRPPTPTANQELCAAEVAEDLVYRVEWEGGSSQDGSWRVVFERGNRDPSTGSPYVCRGKRVKWALGNLPRGQAGRYFAWFQVDPDVFEGTGSTGFAVLGKGGSDTLSLLVRRSARRDTLQYGVLCANPAELTPARIAALSRYLTKGSADSLRQFSPLSFVQENSPPRVIIQ